MVLREEDLSKANLESHLLTNSSEYGQIDYSSIITASRCYRKAASF